MRLPPPDLSYSSGFSRNVEWLIGPWFVLFGGLTSILVNFVSPGYVRPDESLPASYHFIPVVFFVLGLLLCYFAFFRRSSRLELSGETLTWFLPFRRLQGHAFIADIDTIWTEQTFQWRRTRTVIVLHDGRTLRVNDGRGINEFVAALVARCPEIYLDDWEAQKRFDNVETVRSFDQRGDS